MRIPFWMRRSETSRRRALSKAERRRRDELLIPLEVGRLEDRRVLTNVAPTITGAVGSLTTIQQNITSTNNTGTLVSQLVNSSNITSDTGKYGIAITSLNVGGSNGTWQYSTNGGSTWSSIGTVSGSGGLLLDGADLVRWNPGSTYTSDAYITFQAWDESTGTIGSKPAIGAGGGSTAFSSTNANSHITIQPIIQFSNSEAGGTQDILDDQTTNPFDNSKFALSVSDDLSGDTFSLSITQLVGGSPDVNLGSGGLTGVTFSENAGVYTINNLTLTQLNSALQTLSFVPSRGTAGNSVTTVFELSVTDSLSETVSDANAAQVQVTGNVTPALSGANSLTAIQEGSTDPAGTQVSNLISGQTNEDGLGIAVTAVDANGTWYYSPDDGASNDWTQISTTYQPVSSTNALLLSASEYVRFVPNTTFVGTATLTFLAWDGTVGTAGSYYNPTTNPGSGAFSNSESSSILVYPAFSITGAAVTDTVAGQTPSPFSNITISGDTDSSDTVTVTITQQLGAGPGTTDQNFDNGLLSGGGLTKNTGPLDSGTYTLTGMQADVQSELRALIFTPASGETAGGTVTTTFGVSVTSALSSSSTVSDDATEVAVKTPPGLSGANPLTAIATNSSNPAGTQVAMLLTGETTDPSDSTLGIAITNADSTNGQWYYSTDDSNWLQLPTVSSTSAFLLANSDYLQFVPAHGFGGEASITFFAWDGSSGTLHENADPSTGAFSTNDAIASITVYPVIAVDGAGTVNVLSTQTAPVQPFAAVSISDPDAGDTVTITITEDNPANGTLSSPNIALTAVSPGDYTVTVPITDALTPADAATAVLQSIVFDPSASSAGAQTTTNFSITVSDTISSSGTGTGTQTLVVTAPPTLTSVTNFSGIPAGTVAAPSDSQSIQVSSLIVGSPSGDGVAVIGVDDSAGVWQYATNGGGSTANWQTISPATSGANTVSLTNFFLLGPNDYIRFESTTGGAPTTATITLLAWDPSISGNADTFTDPTSIPGAYSDVTASLSSSIAIYPALSITGTGTTPTHDNQTSNPFNNGSVHAFIGDSDPDETLTITITQQLAGGGTDSTQKDGALTSSDDFSGFTDNLNGTYTLKVTASDASAELQALVFTPTAGPSGTTVDTMFQIQVQDATAPVVTDSNTLVQAVSVAPPSLTGSNSAPPVAERVSEVDTNDYGDSGIQVSSLPLGVGSSSGIAISAVDDSNGTWEYSTNGTSATPTWTPIPSADSVGVLGSNVFLLAPTDYIRFLPNVGFTGAATFTFQAWNQGTGGADRLANPANKLLAHDLSPSPATATVTVYPVITLSAAADTTSLDDQTSNPFGSATVGDTLSTDTVTITITLDNPANGTLSSPNVAFTSAVGGVYTLTVPITDAMTPADAATAVLDSLVFTPTPHEVSPGDTVVTKFTIQVSDSGFGGANTIVSPTAWQITVTANPTPVLTSGNNPKSIAENTPLQTVATEADAADTVASLFNGSDSAHTLSIAITSAPTTSGTWYYSLGVGDPWIAITGVTSTNALLLARTDLIRFFPNASFYGTASITFLAWDQTVGLSTGTIDPTIAPGSGAFSANTVTSTIQVVAPATILVTEPTQTTNDKISISVFSQAFGSQPGVSDPNTPAQTYTVTVTQTSVGSASPLENGSLAGGGFVDNNGTYTLSGVTAAEATAALEALVFTPTAHQVTPGDSVITDFTITVSDGITTPTTNSQISLVAKALIDPPTFEVQAATYNLPVLAANGAPVGSAPATDIDKGTTISYSILPGSSSTAFAIDANGNITVADAAALTYSATPIVLTITATNTSSIFGVAPATSVLSATRTIYLWQIVTSSTPISADSSTTLSVTLQTGGTVSVPVTVNWGDGSTMGPVTLSSADPSEQFVHFFSSNPDKTDPAAPIPIDVAFPAAGQTISTQTLATVSGTGVGIAVIPDTTSSFTAVVMIPQIEIAPTIVVVEQPVSEQVDVGEAPSQTTGGTERTVMLQIVSPSGDDLSNIQLPETSLSDLPGLFRKLPDGHYRIFFSEGGAAQSEKDQENGLGKGPKSETANARLLLDVMVRQGRPVDAGEDSGDTGDRPPTSKTDSDQADGLAQTRPPRATGDTISTPPVAGPLGTVPVNQLPPNQLQPNGLPPNSLPAVPLPDPLPLNSAPQGSQPGAPAAPISAPAKPTAAILPAVDGHSGNFEPAQHATGGQIAAHWAALGVGAAAAAMIGVDPERTDAIMQRVTNRGLSKSARLSRRLRRSADVEPATSGVGRPQ